MTASAGTIWQLESELDTIALAHELSLFVSTGDWIGLVGDLGAGKTTFARALIQAFSSDGDKVEVPSPTFTLVQLYNECRVPVAHFDLYRLNSAADAEELGMDELAETHLVVTEWPDRLDGQLPDDRLMVELNISGDTRTATLRGHGVWHERLERIVLAARFIAENAAGCARRFLQGDASTRRYERLLGANGTPVILMDMPARSDSATLDGGKSYSQIVHLADDISAVVAVNQALKQAGFSAPQVLAVDFANGFAILEDFGDQVYGTLTDYGADTSEPMLAAADVLAGIAGRTWPQEVTINGITHRVARYDQIALGTEIDLLIAWFWPQVNPGVIPEAHHAEFKAVWRPLLQELEKETPAWVLRDYHSPNLMWLPDRDDLQRVGIIDTQDAVLGPVAYDLVSLLQDARIDVPAEVETELLDYYVARRQADQADFNEQQFRCSYAIMGAQRACKILGIFARLSKRDGKHGYLRHIPRVSKALDRNLQHPALAELKAWFEQHLPSAQREAAGNRPA